MSRHMPDLMGHPDFFVPGEARSPSDEYYEKVRGLLPRMWRMRRGHVWTQISKPEPLSKVQGWKIHVSARFDTAEATLEKVVPLCVRHGVEMKFASDMQALSRFLGKTCARSQGGKFIAIYPRTKALFEALIEDLHVALKDFDGPYILSDRAYKDSNVVFYRYGGFASVEGPYKNGARVLYIYDDNYDLIEDVRGPSFHLPGFVKDALADEAATAAVDESGEPDSAALVLGDEFEITEAIQYSNAGGVYIGKSVVSGQKALIKETRPYIGHDPACSSMDMLKKEYRILAKLADDGISPKPLKLFTAWNHLFLAQEFVEGVTISQFQLRTNKLIHSGVPDSEMRDWLTECTSVAINVISAIQKLHAKGVIFGDLSKNNIMVDPGSLRVTLIDFEGAYEPGVDHPVNLHTVGFAMPDRISRATACLHDDYFALGCVMLGMIMPTTGLVAIKHDYAETILRELERDIGLRGGYVDCVRQLLSGSGVDLDECIAMLKASDVRSVKSITPVVLRSSEAMECSRRMRNDISEYLLHVMDTSATDRVFPVGPDEHDPLSVEKGALGVAYAVNRLGGSLPPALGDWLRVASTHGKARRRPGLMDGFAGQAWVFDEIGLGDAAIDALHYAEGHRELYGDMSLGYGAAGYGLSCLRMWQSTKVGYWLEEATRIADILCETAVDRAQGRSWQDPEGPNGADIGLTRGASGIALFFLYMHCATKNPDYLRTGEEALAFDLSFGKDSGGSTGFSANTKESILYPYLSCGTAGVGSVVLRYHAVTGGRKYAEFLGRIRPVLSHKYSTRSDLFMGIAGLGNYLLDAHALLKDPSYLDLALNVATGLTPFAIRRPQGVCFPDSSLMKVNCSYGYGSAGIGLFLDRLVNGTSGFNFTLDALLASESAATPTVVHAAAVPA